MPPHLPSLLTPALLSAIRGQPHLPSHAWYFVAGVALSVLNRPDDIADVFKHALEKGPARVDAKPGHDEQLVIARKMREALVKAAAIGGLPKVRSSTSSMLIATSQPITNAQLVNKRIVRAQRGNTAVAAGRAPGLLADGEARGCLRCPLVDRPA